jgi:hypothetical protein
MKTKPNELVFTDKPGYGLTKREYFAAMAMQGILADPNVTDEDAATDLAVKCADFLILRLNNNNDEY